MSVTDLHREDFAEYVRSRLDHHRVDPRWLQIEITESALMIDPGRTLTTSKALKSLGVSLSMDDFGTGYSSMSQLHWLPVTEIKVDRSFVSRMQGNEDDRTIVRSMIDLGRALGKRVVAEGVENEATWAQLRDMGCDHVQGWYICAALPVAEVTQWLTAQLGSESSGLPAQRRPVSVFAAGDGRDGDDAGRSPNVVYPSSMPIRR